MNTYGVNKKKHRRMLIPAIVLVVLLAGAFIYQRNKANPDSRAQDIPVIQKSDEEVAETEPSEPDIDSLPSVQQELDAYIAGVAGGVTFGVILEDSLTGEVLASHRANEPYFAASIYKLYVAYLGLIDIEAGLYEPDEPYTQGLTREACISAMIRDSNSPCAEKMWVEQGKEASDDRLKEFGVTNTSMVAITTTAHDANRILYRLQQETDLGSDSSALLRQALKDQIYKEAIPTGLPSTTVYNKVGFYETGWHDAAIVTLPSGREVVLTVFNQNAGSRQTAALARTIFEPLLDL
ncbi:hypothetical protein BH23PAT2_BH23PAT2_01480 [soil metagenome]